MTETTTITDLGNGWTRRGGYAVWTGGPREAFIGGPVRDVLRLSMWRTGDVGAAFRIEMATIAEDDDAADLSGLFEGYGSNSADLPVAALPELAKILVGVLGVAPILAAVEQVNDEREAYLQRLTDAVGGNMTATLGEAEAALKSQTQPPATECHDLNCGQEPGKIHVDH